MEILAVRKEVRISCVTGTRVAVCRSIRRIQLSKLCQGSFPYSRACTSMQVQHIKASQFTERTERARCEPESMIAHGLVRDQHGTQHAHVMSSLGCFASATTTATFPRRQETRLRLFWPTHHFPLLFFFRFFGCLVRAVRSRFSARSVSGAQGFPTGSLSAFRLPQSASGRDSPHTERQFP